MAAFLGANTFALDLPPAPIDRRVGPCADCQVLVAWFEQKWNSPPRPPIICGYCASVRMRSVQ